ncbi:cytochrome c-type biogenesis protein CcmF, mitochondrion (mitochondrion) [Artemisia annua]|uniref:Cytochrome c-type biogenesis protein CcmF, mitochondrion n=1 Tax=Artemisia annua TaxID=35608 RepID=A0A2U1MH00_ARTAN|nr:cytochrome c-type biogenesis protein CcmF, mitochondrion [Artemisia annua]
MRQKLVPRTVRRPSPTPAVRVRLRLTNTKKIQFTQRLPLGSELHMGKERCCLQGIDYLHGPTSHSICGNFLIYKPSPTNDRLMFEDDESLRVDLLPINFPASYENGKLEHFLHRWMKNREHKNFWLTMFPEKRYFQETTNTTEVAIHTNPFTDLYAPIGTSSSRTGGCCFSRTLFYPAEGPPYVIGVKLRGVHTVVALTKCHSASSELQVKIDKTTLIEHGIMSPTSMGWGGWQLPVDLFVNLGSGDPWLTRHTERRGSIPWMRTKGRILFGSVMARRGPVEADTN